MFRSFFMAGFECATGYNRHNEWIDQVEATEHHVYLAEDYRRLRQLGIEVVREGVRWPLLDQGARFHPESLRAVLEAAEAEGMQVIFDLFHYGYPEDLNLLSDGFVERFASYCSSVASEVKRRSSGPSFFTPVNEPSYFAWAAGDAGLFRPHSTGRSFEIKVQLARAAIAGMDAIWRVLPSARMVNVDPICRVVCPSNRPDLEDEVQNFNENVVFQAWDMLCGRLLPELGGSPRHLDILGLNYYWTNQWEHLTPTLPLSADDERSWSLGDLIRSVWERYHHEMIVSETAHCDDLRADWIDEVAREAEGVLNEGIPLRGVCLYPVLGMPEWHERERWTRMGLWDLQTTGSNGLERVAHEPSLLALKRAQAALEGLDAWPAVPIGSPVPNPFSLR